MERGCGKTWSGSARNLPAVKDEGIAREFALGAIYLLYLGSTLPSA